MREVSYFYERKDIKSTTEMLLGSQPGGFRVLEFGMQLYGRG
jgi:hypothetical protein